MAHFSFILNRYQPAIEAVVYPKCSWNIAVFFHLLSRCYPLSHRPPLLRLCCADGSSSTQLTISVMSLHIQTLRAVC